MPEKDMTILASLIDKVSELGENAQETILLCATAYKAGVEAGKKETAAAQ